MIDYYAPNIDLTLLGCGFLFNYHLGAIYLLSQVWPHRPYNRICGASCGGIIAAIVLSGVPLEEIIAKSSHIIAKMRAFFKNPTKGFVSVHGLLEQLLDSVLPEDAHQKCNNRAGVSVTRLWPPSNIFASQFESRQDLIEAVVAGCFIPVWSGSFEFPKYRGQKCVDGGYSGNTPKFPDLNAQVNGHNKPEQVTSSSGCPPLIRHVQVCAFSSDVDISPPDRVGLRIKCFGTVYYLSRRSISISMATLLPFGGKVYRKILVDGHRDMKNYILNNDIVRCQRCTLVTPPPSVRWSCLACLKLMEKVDSLTIPQHLLSSVAD